MKKALLTLGIALAAMTTQAQDFRVGITGGLNSTWLLNNNVFDANDELDVAEWTILTKNISKNQSVVTV